MGKTPPASCLGGETLALAGAVAALSEKSHSELLDVLPSLPLAKALIQELKGVVIATPRGN